MRRFRSTLIALALLLGLALLLTWPVPLHLGTHAPGDGSDDPAILWNLWWVRYALTDLVQSPFESAWMFWPIGINLVFYTLTVLNALISIPLQLSTGLVAANSFVVYFQLVVAGLGMWLLARWVLTQHPEAAPGSGRLRDGAAMLAAITYAFGSSKWLYLGLGQFNIASSHWLPWAVLYLARMWTAPTWRRGLRETAMCALFVLFSGWTEFTYASFFIQFAALFWLVHAVAGLRQGEGARVRRYTALSGGLALLFLLGMAPILWLMVLDLRRSGDFLAEGLGFSNIFSNDLLGFLVPGDLHPLFGGPATALFDFAYLNFAFLGWVTGALAVGALLGSRTRRFAIPWVVTAGAFVLLSLGPTLRINGREWPLPMPFDLMLALPLFKANRYPSRYSVLIALSLGILVAWGASALLQRLSARARSSWAGLALLALLAMGIVGEHLALPLPLQPYVAPPVYELVRTRPGAALLEVPLAWRNGFRVTGSVHPAFMAAQAFQSVHQKRLLSGNTSRNPEFKFQYFTELPLVDSLIALETGRDLPPGRAAADGAVAGELLRLLDSPTIVVRRVESSAPFPVTTGAALDYLEQILPARRSYSTDEYVALDLSLPAPPGIYAWDGKHPLARLFLAEGWSALPARGETSLPAGPIYAEAAEARMLLPSIASPDDWRLSFESWLPDGVGGSAALFLRDPAGGRATPLGTILLGGRRTHEIVIPASGPRGPLSELLFRFEGGVPAGTVARAEAGEGGLPFSLLVESAQEEAGKFAHIYLNGEDVTGSGSGYHLALLSPDGRLLQRGHFNTLLDADAGARLAAAILAAPTGTIVALAAEDSVSIGEGNGDPRLFVLDDAVVEALATAGAGPRSDLRGRHRWSHAFIGIRGAPPGSALEDASPIRPARVGSGPPLHAPVLYTRLDTFRLEPLPSR